MLAPLGSRLPACPHRGQNQSTPPNGLFALKICRSNPKPGHEINPMALYAHYKAFCCVMISLARPAAYIIVPNPFFTSCSWKRELLLLRDARGLFCGNCWGTNCKIGARAAKMGLVTPPLTLSLLPNTGLPLGLPAFTLKYCH